MMLNVMTTNFKVAESHSILYTNILLVREQPFDFNGGGIQSGHFYSPSPKKY